MPTTFRKRMPHRYARRALTASVLAALGALAPARATTFELLQSGWTAPAGLPPASGIGTGDLLVSGPLNPGFSPGSSFANNGTMSLLSHTEGGGLLLDSGDHLTNNGQLESGYTAVGAGSLLENTVSGVLRTNRVNTSLQTAPAPGTLRTLTQVNGTGLASVESLQVLGRLANEGAWTDYGSTTVYGAVDNYGSFLSTNNTALVLPAPFSLPYTQQILIAHHPVLQAIGPARGTNYSGSTLQLDANTTLTNQGEFTNQGTLTVHGRFYNVPNPVPPAYAQPPTWGNGRFSNGSAQSPGQVIIGSGGQFQTGEFQAETLTNEGSFTVLAGGRLYGGNHFINQGSAQVVVRSQGAFQPYSLDNSATLQVDAGGYLQTTLFAQSADGMTTAAGTIEVTGANGRLGNQGVLEIPVNGAVSSRFVDQSGGVLIVDGSLDVPGLMTHTGGVISGNGIINGHSFTQGDVGVASWSPGSSPGTLTIHGDMTFGDRSLVVLQAEVDGAGFLAWDHMIADRMTFLSGSVIRLALGPGTELRLGESSELLTCTVACDFSGARFEITGATGAQILQGALGLTVTLAPVPEPAHWALLLAGLAMVTGFRQRGRAERTIASPRQL